MVISIKRRDGIKMKLSNRVLSVPESPVRNMDDLATSIKNKGINILHLNIGDPDIKTPEAFWQSTQAFHEPILSYAKAQGIEELITAMQKYYAQHNMHYDKDEILVTAGGSEAISMVLCAICDCQDEVIVFEPFYSNYNGFTKALDVNINAITTKPENGFHLPDEKVIVDHITPKTKALFFSNPGNPTGTVYTKDEMLMLAKIAKEHDLYLISDEVYREFVYDDLEYTSAGHLTDIEDRVIVVDSISKRYSACGARIGCVASKNKDLMANVLKLCQNRLCVSTIEQIGATALYNADQEFLVDIKKEYDKRRNMMYNSLSEVADIKFEKPSGAFYFILNLPVKDAVAFTKWLLSEFNIDKETVMLSPAQGFYQTDGLGVSQVRLAYVLDCEKLARAANIIKLGLKEYKEKHE